MLLVIQTPEGAFDLYTDSHNQFYATLQINNLFNLNTREANYTRVLNIPNSPKNSELLGGLSVHSTFSNKEIPCNIIVDGVALANRAALTVRDVTNDNIEIVLLFGNFSFFTLVPDTNISELDFSVYNFYLDIPGLAALAQLDEGIMFGMMSWFNMPDMNAEGLTAVTNDFFNKQDVYNTGFVIYCKTVFEKIVTSVGYTLDDSDVNDLDLWNNTVLPCALDQFVQNIIAATQYARVVLDSPKPQVAAGTTERLRFVVDSDPGGLWNPILDEFVIPANDVYYIDLYYIGDFLADTNLPEGHIRIYVDTTVVAEATWTTTQTFEDTLTHSQALVSGQVVWAQIFGDANHPIKVSTTSIDESAFSISTNITIADRNIIVSDQLPEITQKTFLTAFASIMNIFISVDDLGKNVKLREFKQMAQETPIDLSNNVDKSIDDVGTLVLDNYFQESELSYLNAGSLLRDDASAKVFFDNDGLLPAGNILSLQLNAMDQAYIYGHVVCYTNDYGPRVSNLSGINTSVGTNTYTLDSPADIKNNSYIQVNFETRRVASVTGPTSGTVVGNWIFNNTSADYSLVSFTANPQGVQIGYVEKGTTPFLDLVDGDFETVTPTQVWRIDFPLILTMESIILNEYARLFEALHTPLVVETWMIFTSSEILDIDFLRPVYLKEYSAYFYINKIEQWKVNVPCRVTLIRISIMKEHILTIRDNG